MSIRLPKCVEILFLLLFLIFFAHCAHAGAVRLDAQGELGTSVEYLVEKAVRSI